MKKCFEFACEANFRKSTIPEYKREYEDIENRCKYIMLLLERFYHLCLINLLQTQVGVQTAENPTTKNIVVGKFL